jgi:hypothetical protein
MQRAMAEAFAENVHYAVPGKFTLQSAQELAARRTFVWEVELGNERGLGGCEKGEAFGGVHRLVAVETQGTDRDVLWGR